MTITYALVQMVGKIADKSKGKVAPVITEARAHELTVESDVCTGLVYEKTGTDYTELGPTFCALEASGQTLLRIRCLPSIDQTSCTCPPRMESTSQGWHQDG